MSTLAQQLAAVTSRAIEIQQQAKGRDFTADEISESTELANQALELRQGIDQQSKASAALDALRNDRTPMVSQHGRDLAEWVVKSTAFGNLAQLKGSTGQTISFGEYQAKANTDPLLSTDLGIETFGGIAQVPLRQPTIADLMPDGQIASSALKYLVQQPIAGAAGATGEGKRYSQVGFSFTPAYEHLAKITAWTRLSEETLTDAAYVESVVRSQLVRLVQIGEEDQILQGDGTGDNMTGILNRSGLQTLTAPSVDANIDTVYQATTAVQNATYLAADGIVIHPTDYETFRLSKDDTGQYFGGGPFMNPYGQPGIAWRPPLWGLPTVVTAAIPQGTVLVGAFGVCGQIFRNGGTAVAATNLNEDDFVAGFASIRAAERLMMPVYQPAGFAKVTLATPTPPAE